MLPVVVPVVPVVLLVVRVVLVDLVVVDLLVVLSSCSTRGLNMTLMGSQTVGVRGEEGGLEGEGSAGVTSGTGGGVRQNGTTHPATSFYPLLPCHPKNAHPPQWLIPTTRTAHSQYHSGLFHYHSGSFPLPEWLLLIVQITHSHGTIPQAPSHYLIFTPQTHNMHNNHWPNHQ